MGTAILANADGRNSRQRLNSRCVSLLPRDRIGALAALLLVVFCARVVVHSDDLSATFDESVHLTAGYTYLRYQDFRLNPEHPPLTKKLAALPLLALEPLPESLDLSDPTIRPGPGSRSWKRLKDLWERSVWDYLSEWYLGHELMFGVRDEALERVDAQFSAEIDPLERIERHEYLNDADRLLFWGRMPLLVFGVLMVGLVFSWARDLWGPQAGLLALALCSFSPDVVAHTTLITSDVAAASLILGTIYGLWRCGRFGGWRNAAMTIVFFSLAITVKFSALVLIPIGLCLVVVSGASLWRRGQHNRARQLVAVYLFSGVALLFVLWGAYGFRFSAVAADPSQPLPVDRILAEVVRQEANSHPEVADKEYLGALDRTIAFANRYRLLPEAFLQGLAIYRLEGRARPAFLNGEYSRRGFRSYFFWSFLFKTPLVTILIIAAGTLFALWTCRREDLLFLILPVVVFFAVVTLSTLNIGNRHILPVYPFLFILGAGVAPMLSARWPKKSTATLALCGGLVALSSVAVFAPPWHPTWIGGRPLEYFNELAGGPQNGYKRLVNSNLDWGQGLNDLAAWLEKEGIDEPINLCYFGTSDPRFYQIRHVRAPCEYMFSPPLGAYYPLHPTIVPGYLAISATHLQAERASEELREIRRQALKRSELVDRVGNSIFIYRLEH